MKRFSFLLTALLLCVALAGCAAPASNTGISAPPATDTAAAPPVQRTAGALDYSCRTRADCAVKNVGNCCGAEPACVNKDSPVDPAAVQAQCKASGMMSICGFQEIASCQCVSGRCEPEPASARLLPSG